MVDDLVSSSRIEPGYLLDERAMLEGWLEFHRETLVLKCEGLDDDALRARPIATSKLSLHGLVRHMAEVERNWFSRVLARDPSVPYIWFDVAREDSELEPLDHAIWGDDLAAWRAECATSRQLARPHALDDTGLRGGLPCSLRWIYTHMIEEYARHNGHADLIRELIDGSVGC